MSYLHLSPLRSVFLRVAAIILVLLAMLRDGRCGVDRLVRYPAHLEVILMLGIEFLPVFNALCSMSDGVRMWYGSSSQTCNSCSVNPRKSWVRWVLKHPVPNARAASTPALCEEYQVRSLEWACRTRFGAHIM